MPSGGVKGAGPPRVLCVHGVGNHPPGGAWETSWKEAILEGARGSRPEIRFVHYDDIFASHKLGFWETVEALGKLVGSAVSAPFRRERGLSGSLRWTAGMVVQWVENDRLRRETRARLKREIDAFSPDVICAHSLGSLIAYDTFTEPATAALVRNRLFVSLGSQINNPFVSGNFLAGRVMPLPEAAHWYHLYNRHDDVFTARIRLSAPNFEQVETPFDEEGIADHSAHRYLAHPATAASVWTRLAAHKAQPRLFRRTGKPPAWREPARRKALLVGINDYPDPSMRLEGCINDVYLMSALLQESGFAPDEIRVVTDGRATAQGILDRLEWLVDDLPDEAAASRAKAPYQRFFYYSGHGAQMPGYGLGDRVDRKDESLVPHDFDWSPARAITDDRFREFYTQIPYGVNFLAMLDCCHSGGMTRDGLGRVRGLNPPDDIRHRALRWEREFQMWVGRDFVPPNRSFAARQGDKGVRGSNYRLGRATQIRRLERAPYKRACKRRHHHGPYMPLLLYACEESEFSYEYQHGNTSYGAFTYSFAKWLRRHRAARGRGITFAQLVAKVRKELQTLGYAQHPQLVGPTAWKRAVVPLTLTPPRPPRQG